MLSEIIEHLLRAIAVAALFGGGCEVGRRIARRWPNVALANLLNKRVDWVKDQATRLSAQAKVRPLSSFELPTSGLLRWLRLLLRASAWATLIFLLVQSVQLLVPRTDWSYWWSNSVFTVMYAVPFLVLLAVIVWRYDPDRLRPVLRRWTPFVLVAMFEIHPLLGLYRLADPVWQFAFTAHLYAVSAYLVEVYGRRLLKLALYVRSLWEDTRGDQLA